LIESRSDVNSNPIKQFHEFLEGRSLHMTEERRRVAVTVFTLPRSTKFAVEDLYNALETTSRATVYRTLSLLVDARLVQRDVSSDGSKVFSHDFETESGETATLMLPVNKYADLCAASHRSLITGRCPWCGQTIINGRPS
jgi:Fe2+ or Zn2+ uptake regulation protein